MTFPIPRPDWVSDRLIEERGEFAQFQMFSRDGNDAVGHMLLTIFEDAEQHDRSRDFVTGAVRQGVKMLAAYFPEVHDTEPEHAITDALNAFLSEHGFAVVNREVLF